jgi:hypothetical protein
LQDEEHRKDEMPAKGLQFASIAPGQNGRSHSSAPAKRPPWGDGAAAPHLALFAADSAFPIPHPLAGAPFVRSGED